MQLAVQSNKKMGQVKGGKATKQQLHSSSSLANFAGHAKCISG